MVTLFLLASGRKAPPAMPNSWEDICKSSLAKGYGLSNVDLAKLVEGCPVVLLRKDREKRYAEGRYLKCEQTERWAGSRRRFDICLSVDKLVDFPSCPPRFNRWGVHIEQKWRLSGSWSVAKTGVRRIILDSV